MLSGSEGKGIGKGEFLLGDTKEEKETMVMGIFQKVVLKNHMRHNMRHNIYIPHNFVTC